VVSLQGECFGETVTGYMGKPELLVLNSVKIEFKKYNFEEQSHSCMTFTFKI